MRKNLIRTILFFLTGAGLFWYVYRNLEIHKIQDTLSELKYGWIFLSFFLGLSSHFLRAVRWKMLIQPMGHQPRTLNLFLSVLVLYFINLVIPRGGEIARCGTVTKFEQIPFVKLVGTVFVERLTDVVAFFLIFAGLLFWKLDVVKQMFSGLKYDFTGYDFRIFWLVGAVFFIVLVYWLSRKLGWLDRLSSRIKRLKEDIKEGVQSVLLLRNKSLYLVYTLLIFVLWLFMLYVIFFAYTPTSDMSFAAAIFAYTVGTFAYLLPIQAGIGVWHFLIIQALFLFGLEKEFGMMYALIAHTFTNLVYLIFGGIGFVLLPFFNQNSGFKFEKLQLMND